MNQTLYTPVQPEVPTISLFEATQYIADRGLEYTSYISGDQRVIEVTVPGTNLLTRRYVKPDGPECPALICCVEQMKAELEKDLGVSI